MDTGRSPSRKRGSRLTTTPRKEGRTIRRDKDKDLPKDGAATTDPSPMKKAPRKTRGKQSIAGIDSSNHSKCFFASHTNDSVSLQGNRA